jgi:hypothetical protein
LFTTKLGGRFTLGATVIAGKGSGHIHATRWGQGERMMMTTTTTQAELAMGRLRRPYSTAELVVDAAVHILGLS